MIIVHLENDLQVNFVRNYDEYKELPTKEIIQTWTYQSLDLFVQLYCLGN